MAVSIIFLTLLGVFALYMLWRSELLKSRGAFISAVVLTVAAMLLRFSFLKYESDDYLRFLMGWTGYFRDNGGLAALASYPGNYNPPYMVLLALFTYLNIEPLIPIKLTSVFFDILAAWSCMKLLSVYEKRPSRLIACFFTVLLLPTVSLNGAYWGQCDSIYAFFGVYAVYLALAGKPTGSMFSLAASLAFKLQAVFIMPVFFVLLVAGRIRWKHLFLFPAAYVLYMLPAVIAGMPFADALTVYFREIGTVGSALNYNAPSFTALLYGVNDDSTLSLLLTVSAFVFMLAVFGWALLKRGSLNSRATVGFALVLAMGIPFLLPHMHDRYFYIAGILALTAACGAPKYFLMPLLAELASMHCYYAYFSGHYLTHPYWGGVLMTVSLALAVVYTSRSLQNKNSGKIENCS